MAVFWTGSFLLNRMNWSTSLTNELAKVDCSFDIAQRIVGVVFLLWQQLLA
jgi:hypothetical protein